MKIRDAFLPMSRPAINEDDVARVVRCLRSGWITTGPLCQSFEERLCGLTGARYALSVSSATAGMHLMLTALGIGGGDEVITPSLTFASTVNMIVLRGARPVFVDVAEDTLNLDVTQVSERITPRTRAIIPVHYAGAPADMAPLLDLVRDRGITVIEDAAHALGTTYRGVHAGGFGIPALFSFHPIKNITCGEGGMVTHNDDALQAQLRLLRFHGIERDAWKRYGKGTNPEYDIHEPGYKYNLPDLLAALGDSQLQRLPALNARRLFLAGIYRERLAGLDGLALPGVPDYPHTHSWHLFIVRILRMPRARFMEGLAAYNIGYGLHFPATHLLSYVRERFQTEAGLLPVTERVAPEILSLPLFPDMQEDDVHYVCDAVGEILARG